jgi:CheY-like chemotaxis protein
MLNDKPILLVAEDDPDDQEFIQEAIAAVCPPTVETYFVDDGVALMDYFQGDEKPPTRPALIILDLNMPRKDGRAALREMKADGKLADIPVVILTTSNSDVDRNLCQQLGAEGFYRKPSRAAELKAIFMQLCSRYIS